MLHELIQVGVHLPVLLLAIDHDDLSILPIGAYFGGHGPQILDVSLVHTSGMGEQVTEREEYIVTLGLLDDPDRIVQHSLIRVLDCLGATLDLVDDVRHGTQRLRRSGTWSHHLFIRPCFCNPVKSNVFHVGVTHFVEPLLAYPPAGNGQFESGISVGPVPANSFLYPLLLEVVPTVKLFQGLLCYLDIGEYPSSHANEVILTLEFGG